MIDTTQFKNGILSKLDEIFPVVSPDQTKESATETSSMDMQECDLPLYPDLGTLNPDENGEFQCPESFA